MLARPFARADVPDRRRGSFLGEYRGQPAVQNANRTLLEPSASKPADYNRLVRYQGRTINQKLRTPRPCFCGCDGAMRDSRLA